MRNAYILGRRSMSYAVAMGALALLIVVFGTPTVVNAAVVDRYGVVMVSLLYDAICPMFCVCRHTPAPRYSKVSFVPSDRLRKVGMVTDDAPQTRLPPAERIGDG